MGRGRRQVDVEDPRAWVFNEMAEVYDARPPYPTELVDAVAELATPHGGRVLDLGAGIGHFTLPLAERGLAVTAVEPARAMLEVLRGAIEARGVAATLVHRAAEALPFATSSFELVVIADALHFVDVELTAAELVRVLAPGGALAIVTVELADTPFMLGVRALLEAASDRRPRQTARTLRQLAALTDVRLDAPRRFEDATPVDAPTLERILRSFSFVGPAMGPARLGELGARLRELSPAPVWARTLTLHAGQRRLRRTPWAPPRRQRGRGTPRA